jgi:hypothetical protein
VTATAADSPGPSCLPDTQGTHDTGGHAKPKIQSAVFHRYCSSHASCHAALSLRIGKCATHVSCGAAPTKAPPMKWTTACGAPAGAGGPSTLPAPSTQHPSTSCQSSRNPDCCSIFTAIKCSILPKVEDPGPGPGAEEERIGGRRRLLDPAHTAQDLVHRVGDSCNQTLPEILHFHEGTVEDCYHFDGRTLKVTTPQP